MFQIFIGDYKQIKQHITKQYNKIHYTKDIAQELQRNKGLLKKQYLKIPNNAVYFIYDAKLFNNKEPIQAFLNKTTADKTTYICIAETIDKKSAFYKQTKQYIKEFKLIDNSISVDDVVKNPYLLYKVDNTISMLYKLYYHYKFKKNTKGMLVSSSCINYILTGKLLNVNAIQYYILNISKSY